MNKNREASPIFILLLPETSGIGVTVTDSLKNEHLTEMNSRAGILVSPMVEINDRLLSHQIFTRK